MYVCMYVFIIYYFFVSLVQGEEDDEDLATTNELQGPSKTVSMHRTPLMAGVTDNTPLIRSSLLRLATRPWPPAEISPIGTAATATT